MSFSPDDLKERRLALNLERSYCVQAPAGSGKTELLTQRYLSLLARCEHPEEILAITFTRKAASEMRNRILENMAQAQSIDEDGFALLPEHQRLTIDLARQVIARDKEKQWQLDDNTSRLKISTIDSFNAQLTNQLPVVSELGVMPGVVDDASLLYSEAVSELFVELEKGNELSSHIENLLGHVNNQWQSLSDLLSGLLAKRDQWLANILDIKNHSAQAREILDNTLSGVIEQKLAELAKALSPYLAELLPLLHFAADNMKTLGNSLLSECDIEDGLPPESASAFVQWQEISKLLLTSTHTLRKQVDKRVGFLSASDAEDKAEKDRRKVMKTAMVELLEQMSNDAELVRLLEEFRHLPDPYYPDAQWNILESLTKILPALVSRLTIVFSRHGQTDHIQVSIAALSALGTDEQHTDLALRLDYHLKHILVDEFQDTSSLQIHLLEKLTYGWQPDDGRTLFIVGDGMQSCYGFRNANVGLFLAARDNGIGQVKLDSLILTTNFRSQAAVVDWVNTWFAPAFPQQDDISRGGVRYSRAQAIHPALPDLAIETILLTAENNLDDGKTLMQRREALLVANKIQEISQQYPGDSIAILVRTRSHLKAIIPAMRNLGIRWNAADIDPLSSYPVVQDLLMLTRALLNPADVTAWFAMLRSPWFGLPLQDLHCLAMAARDGNMTLWQSVQDFTTIEGLSADAQLILARSVPVLEHVRHHRRRLPLREWIEKSWIALGGPATLESSHYLDSVLHFFTLLEEYDESGDISDIHRFEEKVNSKYADGLDPDAPVTIMTIHKAKGLEFDHVLIPGLERKSRPDGNPLLRWREHINHDGHPELLISMPAQRGQDYDRTYQHLKYETTLQQRLETNRLFYIGVTRAIKSACLIGSIKQDADSYKAPDKNSLLASLWPQLEENPAAHAQIIAVAADLDDVSAESEIDELLTRRLKPDWIYPGTAFISSEAQSDEVQLTETVHDNLLERETGDIIHDCLLKIAEGRLELTQTTDDSVLQAMRVQWRLRLAPLTDQLDAAIDEIQRQLQQCSQHEKFQWMLRTPHQEAASELSLSDYRSGHRYQWVIDRTFVDAKGVRWIIDYKSSRPAKGENEAEFILHQEQIYKAQLDRYAGLFAAMEEREIRTALFFTALSKFHEIDTSRNETDEQFAIQDSLF